MLASRRNKVLICLFLHKNLCCGCSLELPRRGDLMSTHNIGFYEDLTKITFELTSNIIKYAPYFFCCVGVSKGYPRACYHK